MADVQAEHGLGHLITTHTLPVVRHIADRLAIMYLGRIVEEGRANEIFARPVHPYTQALVEGVPGDARGAASKFRLRAALGRCDRNLPYIRLQGSQRNRARPSWPRQGRAIHDRKPR